MSGGRFDYLQHRLSEIYEAIEYEISENSNTSLEYPYNFSDETIEEFRKGIEYLKKAQIYSHRIDYLLSHDDGEESFHERLKEDLSKLGYEK